MHIRVLSIVAAGLAACSIPMDAAAAVVARYQFQQEQPAPWPTPATAFDPVVTAQKPAPTVARTITIEDGRPTDTPPTTAPESSPPAPTLGPEPPTPVPSSPPFPPPIASPLPTSAPSSQPPPASSQPTPVPTSQPPLASSPAPSPSPSPPPPRPHPNPPTSTIVIQIPDGRPAAATATPSRPTPVPDSSSLSTPSNSSSLTWPITTKATHLLSLSVTWPADDAPTSDDDTPAAAFFLALFALGAAAHAWRSYRSAHLRPTLSPLVLVFCVLRVAACAVRLAWATERGNEAFRVADAVLLTVGSVLIFTTSAVIGQRLVRYLFVTSLSAFGSRRAGLYLSALLLTTAVLSSIGITTIYIIAAAQAVTTTTTATPPTSHPSTLTLLRASTIWLLALGALTPLLMLTGAIASYTPLRRQDKRGLKLLIFFLSAALLETAQAFRVSALFLDTASRAHFYAACLAPEALVVLLFAAVDLDVLFYDGRLALVRNNSARVGGFVGGVVSRVTRSRNGGGGGEKSPTSKQTPRSIVVRQSLNISVVLMHDPPPRVRRESQRASMLRESQRLSVLRESSQRAPSLRRMSVVSSVSEDSVLAPFTGRPVSAISDDGHPLSGALNSHKIKF